MATAWPLRGEHGKCMASAWQLHGNCMATARRILLWLQWRGQILHGNCMATAWQLLGFRIRAMSGSPVALPWLSRGLLWLSRGVQALVFDNCGKAPRQGSIIRPNHLPHELCPFVLAIRLDHLTHKLCPFGLAIRPDHLTHKSCPFVIDIGADHLTH